jgi:hypothetical protein
VTRLVAGALAGALLAAAPAAASAATVSVDAGVLRVVAASGEVNRVTISPGVAPGSLDVSDVGTPPAPGPGCALEVAPSFGSCAGPVTRIEASLGDRADQLTVAAPVDATIDLRDGRTDSAWCGDGRDTVHADVVDELDGTCERVDYGPPGRVGRLHRVTGGGRFVPIPGQPWARVDRRILPDLLQLVSRYHVRVGDGYAIAGHEYYGEHPLGLAVDLYPGPGGSWRDVARLARWAEPRQNHPRRPFRWVGWNGDVNHGDPVHCRASRGCVAHLHLSWSHSPGAPRQPVRSVVVWRVRPQPAAAPGLEP